jgi:hypothetical protein
MNNSIVSGVALLKDQEFDPKTMTRLAKRLDLEDVSLNRTEQRKTSAKGEPNA